MFDQLLEGLGAALEPRALAIMSLGMVAGLFLGAMPGLGPTMGIAIALPFVIRSDPQYAVFLFMSIIIGAGYGNAIPAVLLRIPGTPSALLTVDAGGPFGRRGEGDRALVVSLFGATVGQICGVLFFAALITPVAAFSVRFLFPEFFALQLLGLTAAAALFGRSRMKGFVSVLIGLAIALIGPDPVTGQPRLWFGVDGLAEGVSIVPALVGLLALREVFASSGGTGLGAPHERRKLRWPRLSRSDARDAAVPAGVGSVVGMGLGALPGAGPTAASFVSYRIIASFPRWRRKPGEGSIPAISATDASQNAAGTSALMPTLALGIPGDAPMVIVMAALTTQGLVVGPQLAQSSPDLLATISAGLLVSTCLMVVLGYLSIRPSTYLASLSQPVIGYGTLVLVITGAFAYQQSMFDVWICLAAGLLGYAMDKYEIPVAPAALALVLGGSAESNLRRGLVMTDGLRDFLLRPWTAAILTLVVVILLAPLTGGLYRWVDHRRRRELLSHTTIPRSTQPGSGGSVEDTDRDGARP